MGRRLRFATLVALAAVGALAPQAQAGTNIGTVLYRPFPGTSCPPDTAWVQTSVGPGGPSYTVPEGGGVITEWTYGLPDSAALAGSLRLLVVRPTGPDSLLVVGRGDEEPVPAFYDKWMTASTRIRVEAGDLIGLQVVGQAFACRGNSDSEYAVARGPGDPAVGTPFATEDVETGSLLNMGAVVEADADGDGFGDETQDGCPHDPFRQGDCKAPDTRITDGPRSRTKARHVKFWFNSDDPEAGFECKLRGHDLRRSVKRFHACESPRSYRHLARGRYRFKVRAVDDAGNRDPKPAKDSFRVV
jgi:hypothetical protein